MSRSLGEIVGRGVSQVPDWESQSGDQIKDQISGYKNVPMVGGYAEGALKYIAIGEANGMTSEEAIEQLVKLSEDPEFANEAFLNEDGGVNRKIAERMQPDGPSIDGPDADVPAQEEDGFDVADLEAVPMPGLDGNQDNRIGKAPDMGDSGHGAINSWGAEADGLIQTMPAYTDGSLPGMGFDFDQIPSVGPEGFLAEYPQIAKLIEDLPELLEQVLETAGLLDLNNMSAGDSLIRQLPANAQLDKTFDRDSVARELPADAKPENYTQGDNIKNDMVAKLDAPTPGNSMG